MWRMLIEEGVLKDKAPNEHVINEINSRLLLESLAAAEGISVEQMMNEWEAELETAKGYDSIEEFMAMLASAAAPQEDNVAQRSLALGAECNIKGL